MQDSWTYAYVNHQATNVNSTLSGANRLAMSYDNAGNMTTQSDSVKNLTKEMQYDSRNRVKQVINPSQPNKPLGRYYYDDAGFRVRKLARIEKSQGNGVVDTDILYASKFFGMEINSTFTAVNNIYLNGVRIAAATPSGNLQYYLTDQVDSVKLILDDNKAEVTRFEYLPYGETFVMKGNQDYAPKYNSQELDKETSFYFYNARYYDPQLARFTTADSVIDGELTTAGWNRYSYVKGNPIRYKDPTGHDVTIDGNEEFRKKMEERLQQISPAAQVDRKTGKVTLDEKVDTSRNFYGNALLQRLVSDKDFTTTLSESSVLRDKVGGVTMGSKTMGFAKIILSDDLEDSATTSAISPSGKFTYADDPGYLTVTHELVHADIIRREGMSLELPERHKETTDHSLDGYLLWTEWAKEAELRTVGVPGYARISDINVNDIRKEHGLPPQLLYGMFVEDPDYFRSDE